MILVLSSNLHFFLTNINLIRPNYLSFYFPQVTKATAKYAKWKLTGSWQFNDWNSWRTKDGMLCRDRTDCAWLDKDLFCQTMVVTGYDKRWFGGNTVKGKCQCGNGKVWNNKELECEEPLSAGMIVLYVLIGLVVLCALCYCFYKRY